MENEGRKFPLEEDYKPLRCRNEEDHIKTLPILLSDNIVDMHTLGRKLSASHHFIKTQN